MTSICDSRESFQRLLEALEDIENKLKKKEKKQKIKRKIDIVLPKKEMSILEAIRDNNFLSENYKKLEGRISKEYIWIYPPGVPLITPGEVINKDIINKIEEFEKAGIEVRTTFDRFPKIEILNL